MYSFTISFTTKSGYDCHVAIEDENWDELLKRASAAIQAVKPLSRQPGDSSSKTPQNDTQQPDAPAAPEAQPVPKPQPRPDWCAVHNCAMQERTNGSGTWHSHQVEEGQWCNGKARQRAKAAAY